MVYQVTAAALMLVAGTVMAGEGVPDRLANLPPNQWVEFNPKANAPIHAQIAGWEQVVYAGCIRRVLIWGGCGEISSEQQNALMAYSPREERWDVVDILGGQSVPETVGPGGHDFGAASYNPKMKSWFAKCGFAMGNGSHQVIQYDLLGNVGRAYWPSAGYFKPIQCMQSCYDPVQDKVIFHTQAGLQTGTYDPTTNTWASVTDDPSQAGDPAVKTFYWVYDSRNKCCLYWEWSTGKVWVYDIAGRAWKAVLPEVHPPVGERENSIAYHPGYGLMFLFVGADQSTWTFDAAAGTWEKTAVKPPVKGRVTPASPSEGLVYDADDDLFVLVGSSKGAQFGGGGYSSAVWGFRYVPADGRKAQPIPPEPPAKPRRPMKTDRNWQAVGGAISRSDGGWARAPAICSFKDQVYLAWAEFLPTWSNEHVGSTVFASRLDGNEWKPVDGLHTKIIGNNYEDNPQFVSDGRTLLLGIDLWGAWAGGGTWTGEGNAYDLTSGTARALLDAGLKGAKPGWTARRAPVALFKGTPYAMVYFGKRFETWFKPLNLIKWDTGKWAPEGKDFVFRTFDNSAAQYMAGGENRLYAVQSLPERGPGMSVRSSGDGTTWIDLPSPTADTAAMCTWPALATHKDDLYLAYLERAMPGRNPNLLVVKKWDGQAWQALGGPLNVFKPEEDDWAFSPGLALKVEGDTVTPYVSFCEHVWNSVPQVFVKHWDGAAWVSDVAEGASLNIDPEKGSAQTARIAIHDGKPVVAWAEHVFGGGRMRKVHVKRLP